MTPLTKMHTLGSQFTPPGFHAGGLRYHGMAPDGVARQGARPVGSRVVQPGRVF